jgi:bifunctional DNase/RNase
MLRAAPSNAMLGLALILVGGALSACHDSNATSLQKPPSGDVRVEVSGVGYDRQSASNYVQLDDRAQQRSLQIAIGEEEARTITLELNGLKPLRPLTSELLSAVIALTGNTVDRVEVTEVRDEIYYASIILDHGRYTLDSRPSDAIALAIGMKAPIYVASDLMQAVRAASSTGSAPLTATNFGVTVQQLTPDLATYFGVEADGGVVIADVGREVGKAGLQRGDIIVEVEGRAIHRPVDFAHATIRARAPIWLRVRRGKATRTITITPGIVARSSH